MKLTNSVISLLTIISWGVFTLLYSIFLPLINEGGGCVGGQRYISKKCESLLGFELPNWIQLTNETYLKASIVFGFFAAAIVCLICIIKKQNASSGEVK